MIHITPCKNSGAFGRKKSETNKRCEVIQWRVVAGSKTGGFAKGHGAPLDNQNAKGHGALARNINAVKTGEYMTFEQDETPYDRLRGGEMELKVWCVNAGHLMMRVRRELSEERQRLKAASSNRVERF